MEYLIDSSPLDKQQQDCVIIGVYENDKLSPSASAIDAQTNGLIKKILNRGDIEGKNGETVLLNLSPDNNIERILVVGLGKSGPLTKKHFRKALNSAIKCLKDTSVKSANCSLAECTVEKSDWQWKTRQIIEVFDDACYQFTQLKSDNNKKTALQTVHITAPKEHKKQAEEGLKQGSAIADAINLAKELADLPGNICTPTYLAEKAVTLSKDYQNLSVNILEEADMQQLGMGALLSVTKGSRQPAKLIALEYQGQEKNNKPVVLVGKGLTFDAGGISLKPGAGMDEMKYDMCGGAAVLATLLAAARLEMPINIVGLIPTSENLPDGAANKPGDIVTSMLGKTIEVLNTDAEGRLILCDTLTYAKKYKPEVIIDLATLTGACLVALGRVPSGLLGNDDELCNDLIAASETACDSLWRLPLWEEYQEQLKSNFADLANIGGRDAGTITAACFLSHFTEDYRWAHLDIAGTAWRTGNNKGATGRPVPLLMQYLLNRIHA
jgi:leucyl aminopeptidase